MPNKRAENVRVISLTLDKDLLALTEQSAARLGITRLQWIREAIMQKHLRPWRPQESDMRKKFPKRSDS